MTLRELKENASALIGKSDFEGVLELLSRRLNPDCALFQDLIQQSSRYNRTLADDHNGVVSRENANLEYNKIAQALLHLVRQLEEKDLGTGGSLDDPLDAEARNIPVDILLSPLHLVNCNRLKPMRSFRRAFNQYLEQQRHFQFYFLPSCPTQQPESFAERTVQELLEKELDKVNEAFDFRRRTDERLLIEPLPLGINEAGCQRAFKKYFTERFGLANSEVAFEDYLRTGLPKLPWQYVATAFKVTASDWDDDILVPYIEWIMNTFSQTGPDIPTFIFFFVVSVKNAHRADASMRGSAREALDSVRKLTEKRPDDATLIEPLPPVPADDLEEWMEMLGSVPQHQKSLIINMMAARLDGEEEAWFRQNKEFNMERIEDFQAKVYHAHKHK